MLTIFSVPREFAGEVGICQHNAIASWVRLPGCEVILFGDDPGVAEAAALHRARHVAKVERNSFGTPILADVFAKAETLANCPMLCFVNADVILFNDLLTALRVVSVKRERFLMVASRFNCRISSALSLGDEWDRELRARAVREGRVYRGGGSDIFLYRRGLFDSIPPFAVGRGYWDNWLMLRARQRGATLIDVTDTVISVHQDHNYSHVVGVSPESSGHELAYMVSEEAERNFSLAGGHRCLYTIYDATEILTPGGRLLSTRRPGLVWRPAKAWLRRTLVPLIAALTYCDHARGGAQPNV